MFMINTLQMHVVYEYESLKLIMIDNDVNEKWKTTSLIGLCLKRQHLKCYRRLNLKFFKKVLQKLKNLIQILKS